MKNDRLYVLISRRLAGEATYAELDELHEYFKEHPDDQYFAEVISAYWNTQQVDPLQSDADSDDHFNHILQMAGDYPDNHLSSNQIGSYPPESEEHLKISYRKSRLKMTAIAASFVLIAGLSWWFANNFNDNPEKIPAKQNEIVANKGTRSRLVLPDSSLVVLNSDTKLKYAQQFDQHLREVYLDGEAFFEIKKDPDKPFIVHTSGMEVKVVGTSFNVKAYSNDKLIETSLITGSIEVSVKNRPNEKIILSPNEKLVIKNPHIPEPVNIDKQLNVKPEIAINQLKPDAKDSTFFETQWVENKLVFRDKTFEEVAALMERWYNVSIKINNDEVKGTLFTGTFKDETIEEALDALKFTKNFQYLKDDETIIIFK